MAWTLVLASRPLQADGRSASDFRAAALTV
jgi:hypothetical protein